MSDFTTAVKYLRLTEVKKVTPEEAEAAQQLNGSSNPSKYLTVVPARTLQQVTQSIFLQPFVPDKFEGTYKIPGRLLFQYNVTMPGAFYILNAPKEDGTNEGVLCVRYRIGTTSYRYAIYGNQSPTFFISGKYYKYQYTFFTPYKNQIIEPNCVFEYWFVGSPAPLLVDFGLPKGYTINTSLLRLPATADDVGSTIASNNALDVPSLGSASPLALPIVQNNLAFVSN